MTTHRVGLVLGSGGVLGAAWAAGALVALQARLDRKLGSLDLIVGTSSGAPLAVALRCGLGAEGIAEHHRGALSDLLPSLELIDQDASRGLSSLPRLRVGSVRLLVAAALAPHRMQPRVAACALMPEGRTVHLGLERLVCAMLTSGSPSDGGGRTWIMAMDYDTGERVAFGRPDAPEASLADAVVASCSIPGWFRPKVIGGRRYVDGGIRSPASLDLLAGAGLDEVYVLAPAASYRFDRPRAAAVLERRFRRWIAAGLTEEAHQVIAAGTRVTLLTPGPEDLEAIGANMMDPSRRTHVLETSLRTTAEAMAEGPAAA